ncbi:imm11 family protein [Hyalangium versicolor]|uniref:imm11 family protein n=1 Tax=Hyalangium versicolor TaxID=2861190 RepID=UPI001CCCBD07|nr:DUF1629 domain-containing protein [Hyalangium versicolor]
MSKRYFDLFENVHVPARWHLDTPVDAQGQELWTWLFRQGAPASVAEPIRIPLFRPGEPLDFSLAGAAVPILHERVAKVFTSLASSDVQLIPVQVESQTTRFFILNALRVVKCIDDTASEEVQRYTPEDGQPELVGEYRNVVGMKIDPSKVGETQVFRPWGWPVVLVVSQEIKEALESMGATGTSFEEV